MASKYKITGFARLLIFLIFLTPVAYIAASYYNGEDGMAKMKALIGLDATDREQTADTKDMSADELILRQQKEIEALRSLNQQLKKDLADCKN